MTPLIHLDAERARRNVSLICDDIRRLADRETARLKAQTDERRRRIEAHLRRIENDCEWRMPTDQEVQFS